MFRTPPLSSTSPPRKYCLQFLWLSQHHSSLFHAICVHRSSWSRNSFLLLLKPSVSCRMTTWPKGTPFSQPRLTLTKYCMDSSILVGEGINPFNLVFSFPTPSAEILRRLSNSPMYRGWAWLGIQEDCCCYCCCCYHYLSYLYTFSQHTSMPCYHTVPLTSLSHKLTLTQHFFSSLRQMAVLQYAQSIFLYSEHVWCWLGTVLYSSPQK